MREAFAIVGGFLSRVMAREDTYQHLKIFDDVVSLISSSYVETADIDIDDPPDHFGCAFANWDFVKNYLIDQVTTGRTDPGAARDHISQMTIRQNNWTVGAYCESYCRIVTTHHTIEDRSVFPHLRGADPRLAPVIDRLEQEHGAIHGVLEQVDRALVAFVSGPDGDKQLREAADLLTDALLSHLAYEERELVEPLARLGFY